MNPIERAFRAGFASSSERPHRTREINERAMEFVAANPILDDDDIATFRHFVASHESQHSPRTREALIRLLDAWLS